jgi:peptide deformylase
LAILRVAQMGHPVLREVAEPVDGETLASDGFQAFCDDLLETMHEYDGAGLAAPQVHVPLRVVVLVLDDERGPEFLVNPVVTPLTDVTCRTWEGCLSVEGIRGAVDRPRRVHVICQDRDGSAKEYVLEGFSAVVVQHECDHLDGVLFVDKADTRTLTFVREYRRYGPHTQPTETDDDEAAETEDAADEAEA